MEIFLTGATGYIGGAVARELLGRGHRVVGLVRNEDSARKLPEDPRLLPLVADLADTAALAQAAREVDAVVHAGATGGSDGAEVDRRATFALLEALRGTAKPFLYTSGVWIMGNTGGQVLDEAAPLDPTPLIAWRAELEAKLLAESGVRAVVVRPAVVYGRGGGLVGGLVDSGREAGVVRYVGDGENRWPLVHVDDLARLYAAAIESGLSNTVFIAAAGPSLRLKDIALAASRAAGIPGRVESWPLEAARQTLGAFADALALDQQVTAAKATRLLGWQSQAPSLPDELARA
ncbi:NAD-dependent epimerase/dehydratase family protein [Gloeobacter violaceus]|uniref:Glr0482 protein n=1 Tax=Gloeobacter violaceus (strain ATCC 29082 / PCC 7421) TaxID=251221 RepID=Q7NNC9_GLOVI|nr:NAD-dependent epimerase/dehydratase family protein [Gloeobacter violaceus]BAC88423.1 glr0482 [Gloeobacter violaceus PCC 7421]